MDICIKDDCTGCTACYNICPHLAISFKEDDIGFLYPTIDEMKCVDCGLCRKVCPNNTPISRSKDQEAFVATAKSVDEQRTSTSGGLASVLSRYVIGQGGVVYGCTGEECTNIHHVRISSEDEITRIKGSKYAQSNLSLCFGAIKKDLQQGIIVLFVGTPCQCAGLKSYLNKEYDNLYLVDFVCHGVPSQRILTESIKYNLKQDNLQGYEVKFRYRDGKKELSVYGLQLLKDGSVKYQKNWPNNDYITGFLRGVYYRESCYACKYARIDRVSDITLGDFWDRENEKRISHNALGLSMVICNSKKGKGLIGDVQNKIELESIPLETLVQHNGQLKKPFSKPKSNDSFKKLYGENGYYAAFNLILRREMKSTKKSLLIGKMVRLLKNVTCFRNWFK